METGSVIVFLIGLSVGTFVAYKAAKWVLARFVSPKPTVLLSALLSCIAVCLTGVSMSSDLGGAVIISGLLGVAAPFATDLSKFQPIQ